MKGRHLASSAKASGKNARLSFAKIKEPLEVPNLLDLQIESFDWLMGNEKWQARVKTALDAGRTDVPTTSGLTEIFEEISPIEDLAGSMSLSFRDHRFEPAKYTVEQCRDKDVTYAQPLFVTAEFMNNETGEIKSQTVFMGDFPIMTNKGTFVINGTERVVVSQLVRSPGVYFEKSNDKATAKDLFTAKVIPSRGAWLEFEVDKKDLVGVRLDRKRKQSATVLLKALGMTAEQIATKFAKYPAILDTLAKDSVQTQEEALVDIYRKMRPGEPPTIEGGRNLIDNYYFNSKRYDLAKVGRYKVGRKLGSQLPLQQSTLTLDDICDTVEYIAALHAGITELTKTRGKTVVEIDDIDHFGNRRLRTVGELIQNQIRTGLSRMERVVRERMTTQDVEAITPQTLINIRPVVASIKEFFGTSQLSQFMDQTNPLAGLTHKRRLSALGPGGLSRERAGFEVRDVHPSHYGRMCPIETPEGPNIGLIGSLSSFARVNEFGFIETPYRKVSKGKVTNQISYLTADEEDRHVIAQANAALAADGTFSEERVLVRRKGGDVDFVLPDDVDFMDVSPRQVWSVATAMIPFLEHDDANRALMGSNMQRQAVPLIKPDAPIVGTGLEAKAARDARIQLHADGEGVVEFVDANEIHVRYERDEAQKLVSFEDDLKVYRLTKFIKTNQETSITLRPAVAKGQRVKKGDFLTEGYAVKNGELALGRNLKVAFMPWKGYNFEDAIVINEKVVSEDLFTSIHISEFELEVRDTKLGEEELTPDIPNVSEEATKDLDQYGIIRIGAQVKEGDILIGKITPKGESDPTPEEKLLRAIFGDKAGDAKDASLKAPSGTEGVVIGKKLFQRAKKDKNSKAKEKAALEKLESIHNQTEKDILDLLVNKLQTLLKDKTSAGVSNNFGEVIIGKGSKFNAKALAGIDYQNINPLGWTGDAKIDDAINTLLHNYNIRYNEELGRYKREKFNISIGDELPAGVLKLAKVYLAVKRKLKVGDKMAGRHGNKGIVAKIVRAEDMPFLEDGTPVDIVLNPLGVPSRMNLGQIYETILGWAGEKLGMRFSTPIFDGASVDEIKNLIDKAQLPSFGHTYLYDGETGERFHQKATVGIIYMLKLHHMVDDKMHARSIGPYSLITQQPLGGKAQFGGQRFGEMEVWALEAYGASNILQELLTLKSDDIIGRAKTYESIVKGDNVPRAGIPESFNVLVHELRGLGLDLKFDN